MDIPIPAHKVKIMQQWLENHVLKFISIYHWPLASPYINPLNYKLLTVSEGLYKTLELLKQTLVEAVDNFPMGVIHTVIDARPNFGAVLRQMAVILNKLCKHFSNQTSSLNCFS